MFIDCASRVIIGYNRAEGAACVSLAPAEPPAEREANIVDRRYDDRLGSMPPALPEFLMGKKAMTFDKEKKSIAATLHKVEDTASLRVVDPFTGPREWAIVDDGCSPNTHSDAWR